MSQELSGVEVSVGPGRPPWQGDDAIRRSRFVFGDESVERGEDECGGVVGRQLRHSVSGRCNVGRSFFGERGRRGDRMRQRGRWRRFRRVRPGPCRQWVDGCERGGEVAEESVNRVRRPHRRRNGALPGTAARPSATWPLANWMPPRFRLTRLETIWRCVASVRSVSSAASRRAFRVEVPRRSGEGE